jgi:hypothetical protein
MTELEKYEAVNKCESLLDLSNVILSLADKHGNVLGRNRVFDASKMALNCIDYSLGRHNTLTREYGIRQQAMYILYYSNENS